ncbi:MAG: hypothetical protein ACRDKZ_02480 [Actinomycetota bacterium]
MSGGFGVSTGPVQTTGGAMTRVGSELGEIEAKLVAQRAVEGACGHPEAAASFAGLICTWEGELARMQTSVTQLGRLTVFAGHLYDVTESAVTSLFGGER